MNNSLSWNSCLLIVILGDSEMFFIACDVMLIQLSLSDGAGNEGMGKGKQFA